MTLKEFEEIKIAKTQEEYESWFDDRAKFQVQIGGILMPCIKLTRSKVALRDKTVASYLGMPAVRTFLGSDAEEAGDLPEML